MDSFSRRLGSVRPAPGGSRDPPARRSPPLFSQARILCQKHDAVLYRNPLLACAESDQPWVLSQNDFFGRKFHIWEGKDEAFKKVSLPTTKKKKGGYRNKGEENISWVTEFCPALPEETNSYIIFHRLTQLLQQAATLGSTSKTEREPLRGPAVPLLPPATAAATFAKGFFSLPIFFFSNNLLLKRPLYSTISLVQKAEGRPGRKIKFFCLMEMSLQPWSRGSRDWQRERTFGSSPAKRRASAQSQR